MTGNPNVLFIKRRYRDKTPNKIEDSNLLSGLFNIENILKMNSLSSNYCTNCQKNFIGIESWFCSQYCVDHYEVDIRSIRYKIRNHLPISPCEQEFYYYTQKKNMFETQEFSDCDVICIRTD